MSDSNQADSIDGQCYCAGVQFSIQLPVFAVIYCHCNMCRNSYGADYTTWVRVLSENFKITQGREQLSEYAISEHHRRYFCGDCGSTLYTSDSEYPDSIGVLRGMIHADVGQLPSKHFFYEHRVSWLQNHDDLQKMGGSSGFEPLD